jgi:hypothetical protein
MNKTPFDKIAFALIENPSEFDFVSKNPIDFSRNNKLLWAFIGTLQIKYLHMCEASEAYWGSETTTFQDMYKGAGGFSAEFNESNQKRIRAKINYFSFIEELNRYGRIFELKHQKIIPDYYRIKFFRNKMIEHWDDYLEFLFRQEGLKIAINKLVIPYHMGLWGGSITEIPTLREEFKKHNITLVLHFESPLDPNYSESILSALETIDHKLGKKEIPDDLVKAIFKFGFPTPIHDLEEYIERLIKWVENL